MPHDREFQCWQLDLESLDPTCRQRACERAREFMPAAFDLLVRRLRSLSADRRKTACRALACLGDRRAVVPLARQTRSLSAEVRAEACRSLGRLADPRALTPLVRRLVDSEETVRWAASEALAAFGSAALEVLRQQLRHQDPLARAATCHALGAIRDDRAIEPLIGRFADGSEGVRRAAVEALVKIGGASIADLIRQSEHPDHRVRAGVCEALGALGDHAALASLLARLQDEEGEVRAAACRALGELKDYRAVSALIECLGDRELAARQAAVGALVAIGPAWVERLLPRVADPDWRVREGACEVLGHLGDQRAVAPLLNCLDHFQVAVRRAACRALGRLGATGVVEALLKRLRDTEPSVRAAACSSLGELGDREAVQPLIEYLGDRSDQVRTAAAEALLRLGEDDLVRVFLHVQGGQPNGIQALQQRVLSGDLRLIDPLVRLATVGWDDSLGAGDRGIAWSLDQVARVLRLRRQQPLCRVCLARFQFRIIEPSAQLTAPLCRRCGRAAYGMLAVQQVVAVLDKQMEQAFIGEGGALLVNWLRRRELFDFDRVHIQDASEYEVERLCIQVGNDTDPWRRRHYRQVICEMKSSAGLSLSSLTMLRRMFGKVVVEEREGRDGLQTLPDVAHSTLLRHSVRGL